MSTVEMWAGVECTINRVQGTYYNQLKRSGHWYRPQDIALIAGLGVKTIRYPCLWEFVTEDGDLSRGDWSWIDERLALLQERGIKPIAGLLHHGSGPRHTDLGDPNFPEKFAAYALCFARRYPWIEDYTPINEPLTTARFCALYGLWYPHYKEDGAFARAVFNECKGIVLAMDAVRTVNPQARLIQTEDLGTIFSTPPLDYQAAYENERRWLSLDLLCGRVDPSHPLWHKMRAGVEEREMQFFLKSPCVPDVMGMNYYVSSDRFLDHRLDLYPREFRGGNHVEPYVDVMAAHAREADINGHFNVLKSAWERFHVPVAVTEVHLDSSRDEQLRWMKEAWDGARTARECGVDVRAVTAWSLLGCFDWNTLVTCDLGYYETGAFDVRSGAPRPTALVDMIEALATRRPFHHPCLETPGWWRRPCRVLDRKSRFQYVRNNREFCHHPGPPLVITGASGTLGQAFARICEYRALSYRLLSREQMDIAHLEAVERSLDNLRPWAVVNAAGYVRVEQAERERERCFRENTTGAQILARACQKRGIPLLTFSTDLVFDGCRDQGYFEHDPVNPRTVYGRSKAEAERSVLAIWNKSLIIRTSSFFGPWDEYNFLSLALRNWQEGRAHAAKSDTIVTPTYVPDLVHTCLDLLIDGEEGIWHITNGEPLTWSDFAHRLAALTNVPPELVEAQASPRQNLTLLSRRGNLLPTLGYCLQKYIEDIECISIDGLNDRIKTMRVLRDESRTQQ